MAYAPTDWVDGVTPVNAANLDKLEAGVAAAVEKDSVTLFLSVLLQSKLLAGDTYAAFGIRGDGRLDWGPGGAGAPDTSLYRASGNHLKTDNQFSVGSTLYAAGQIALGNGGFLYGAASPDGYAAVITKAAGDADNRFTLSNNGNMYWGGGVSGPDANLYRLAAGILRTDGELRVGTNLTLDGVINNISQSLYTYVLLAKSGADPANRFTLQNSGHLFWGDGTAAPDVSFYRDATERLKVSKSLGIELDLYVDMGGAGNRLRFGSAGDTDLYRSAALRLATTSLFDATVLGLATKAKAGTPTDADWAAAPPIGTIVLDTTANKLWVRTAAATWKGVVVA